MEDEIQNKDVETLKKEEIQFNDGDIFYAYVRFYEDEKNGKERPIVAMKNEEDDTWKAFKITSRIEKKMNHKYGYLMEDWEQSGLTKPSIIKCDREGTFDIEPDKIIRKIGDLTERDLRGLLIKTIKVREIEYRREKQKARELER